MKKLLFLSLLSLFVFYAQAQIPSSIKSPDPIVNSPQHLCPFDSLLLSASGSTGNYNWFSDSLGMNFLDSGATFQTGIISSDTIFYVQAYADSGMQTYNFTNCGIIGRTGPSQSDVNTAYAGTNLDGDVSITTQGIQEWIVPFTAKYTIEASGAQGGGDNGGLGTEIRGDYNLLAGDTLKILVGQKGLVVDPISTSSASGGGGSFVTKYDNTPLIVAGGGGGNQGTTVATSHASVSNAGQTGYGANTVGAGGINGNGGTASPNSGGGGGIFTDGTTGANGGPNEGGHAFINGGEGGDESIGNLSYPTASGGFGGGGTATNTGWRAGGGGGGYSGGGGGNVNSVSTDCAGGGGGSFNNGLNQSNIAQANSGHGYVTISVYGINSPSNIIAIVIKLDSVPEIITQPTNTSVVSSNNASFSVAAQGTNLSYQWQESMNAGVNWTDLTDGGTYSGVTTANLSLSAVPLSMDDYYYRCIVSGNCSPSDTSDEAILSVTATGIEEVGLNTAQIYPNPVSNTLTLELNNADSKQLNVRVYDVLGKQQQEWKETSLTQGHQQLSLDVSRLSKGVYYLRIRLDEEVRDFRFVKE
jgi:hypothetical protein